MTPIDNTQLVQFLASQDRPKSTLNYHQLQRFLLAIFCSPEMIAFWRYPASIVAPVLKGKLMTASEFIYVWPDAEGDDKGQSVQPLYKTVPMAVKNDQERTGSGLTFYMM